VPRTKVGIVSFSGTSFVDLPLTESIAEAKQGVLDVSISEVGGTDLGSAIITSANLLISDADTSRDVILLTDGRSNVGTPIEDAIEFAKANQVIVHTIGVATEGGGQFLRIEALSRLDEPTLRKIADETGGFYYKASNKEALQQAYSSISTSTREKVSVELQLPLLLAALSLIFIEWGLINTRFRTMP